MSWKIGGLFGLMVVASSAKAATPGDRPVKLSNEQQAIAYANELIFLTSQISEQYVREVSQSDLLLAGVRGLYDAARAPVPARFEADIRKAGAGWERNALLIDARRRLCDDPALEGNRAIFASIKSLSSALDAHCGLTPASRFSRNLESKQGFGFELDGELDASPPLDRPLFGKQMILTVRLVRSIPFRIVKVEPGSPAQRAGLRPGDVIAQYDGRDITADTAEAISTEMLEEMFDETQSKRKQFSILREGKKQPIEFSIRKQSYEPESVFGVRRTGGNEWHYWLDESARIAYVRIGAIDQRTPGQLANVLTSLRDMNGLILDLRWCPGGFLNPSAEIAALFMKRGPISSVKYRHPERQGQGEFTADGFVLQNVKFADVPLLVLVNETTTGGGELIAAALQDNGRAKIAGQRTLGKGSVQTPIYLNNNPEFAFKLSVGTLQRPNGKNMQRFADSKREDDWGVRPDKGFEIPLSASLGQRLNDWHSAYILRPWDSREAMPLDDPEADPQRFRAIRLLKDLLKRK